MKTAAVEVKSVPDNLLDEVLGPLLPMPERQWVHVALVNVVPCHAVALCGESCYIVEPFNGKGEYCPDCLRRAGR